MVPLISNTKETQQKLSRMYSLRYDLQFNGNTELMYDYTRARMYYGKNT